MSQQTITAPERFAAFVDEKGNPTQRFAEFIETITRQVNKSEILSGSGSPESVIEADPTEQYMDEDTGALYVKQTGVGSTGWVLV